jgi:hypothetical protein
MSSLKTLQLKDVSLSELYTYEMYHALRMMKGLFDKLENTLIFL